MGWEVHPQSLTDILVRLHNDYPMPPVFVTENGAAYYDPEPNEHVVEDPERVSYLGRHFAAVEAAIAQGVNVGGYFVWSLMDNFEWAEGYDKRFGIVHVDFDTLKRTPKRSALFYRDHIAAQLQPV
jgi:beta-glucosidase